MIGAGALDRRITVQRYIETRDPIFNSVVHIWADHITDAPASVKTAAGREFLEGPQIVSERRAVFTIRFADVTVLDRVSFVGRLYNISDVREIGRRRFLELQCEAIE